MQKFSFSVVDSHFIDLLVPLDFKVVGKRYSDAKVEEECAWAFQDLYGPTFLI